MKLSLIADWRLVLTKAWSLRFSMLSAVLAVLELIIPLIPPSVLPTGAVPKGAFAIMAILLNVFIIPAVRVMSQKEITNAVDPCSTKS